MMEKTINIRGEVVDFSRPLVMGILNVTPDSFYRDSRHPDFEGACRRVEQMKAEGADIIDIGGYSTRPGAKEVDADEEYKRLALGLRATSECAPELPVSIDTFRADVARRCCEDWPVDIINDISGGTLDERMWQTVAELKKVYVLMHTRGTPATMQSLTDYDDVTLDVIRDLAEKVRGLHLLGVNDIIVDPGFGFAKTIDQNFRLLAELDMIGRELDLPLLVGLSRKSMLWRSLDSSPEEALNATTVVNTIALLKGAAILRVHDVRQAVEAVKLVELMLDNSPILF